MISNTKGSLDISISNLEEFQACQNYTFISAKADVKECLKSAQSQSLLQ